MTLPVSPKCHTWERTWDTLDSMIGHDFPYYTWKSFIYYFFWEGRFGLPLALVLAFEYLRRGEMPPFPMGRLPGEKECIRKFHFGTLISGKSWPNGLTFSFFHFSSFPSSLARWAMRRGRRPLCAPPVVTRGKRPPTKTEKIGEFAKLNLFFA